jgi:hypothetical protein
MKMFFLSRKNLSLKRHIHLVEKTKRFGLSLATSPIMIVMVADQRANTCHGVRAGPKRDSMARLIAR